MMICFLFTRKEHFIQYGTFILKEKVSGNAVLLVKEIKEFACCDVNHGIHFCLFVLSSLVQACTGNFLKLKIKMYLETEYKLSS